MKGQTNMSNYKPLRHGSSIINLDWVNSIKLDKNKKESLYTIQFTLDGDYIEWQFSNKKKFKRMVKNIMNR